MMWIPILQALILFHHQMLFWFLNHWLVQKITSVGQGLCFYLWVVETNLVFLMVQFLHLIFLILCTMRGTKQTPQFFHGWWILWARILLLVSCTFTLQGISGLICVIGFHSQMFQDSLRFKRKFRSFRKVPYRWVLISPNLRFCGMNLCIINLSLLVLVFAPMVINEIN